MIHIEIQAGCCAKQNFCEFELSFFKKFNNVYMSLTTNDFVVVGFIVIFPTILCFQFHVLWNLQLNILFCVSLFRASSVF